MSKERARRRAEREAEAERLRARRARKLARREWRRALVRKVVPRLPDRRTGRVGLRRTKAERAGVAVAAFGVLFLIWVLIDSVILRIGLTALVLVATPALIVLALDRRT